MNKSHLPENLYRLRRGAGMSQEELADRLSVSRKAVSKWERGEAYPDTENLIAISDMFSVSLDMLIKGEPSELSKDIGQEWCDSNISEAGDNSNEEEDRIEKDSQSNSSGLARILHSVPYVLIVTLSFFLIGFLANGFFWAWTLFITIPLYDSVVEVIIKRRFSALAIPILVTFVYLLIGMLTGIWHPTWCLYLLIPIYYPIAEAVDRSLRLRRRG